MGRRKRERERDEEKEGRERGEDAAKGSMMAYEVAGGPWRPPWLHVAW